VRLKLRGEYTIKQYRCGKLINSFIKSNMIVNEGKDYLLDVMFHGTAAAATWYVGLITNTGVPALSATDTMASHAGWVEFIGYSQATRVAWVEGAASGQEIVSTGPSTFNITATASMFGAFITSDSTKSGTAGKLWSTNDFVGYFTVVNGDVVTVEYKVIAG